jgi:hypothetical protein
VEIDGGGWSEMSTFKVWDHLQSARTLREYHYIYIVQLSLVSKPIQKIDPKFTTCTISAPYITGNDREYARRKVRVDRIQRLLEFPMQESRRGNE